MKYLEPIEETAYLSAPNAPQYRKIMRIFFRENEKMHFRMYKEDVLELLRQEAEFSDYEMDQLKQDLEALVRWKNLTPIQDPGRVYTIADYKNKQYQYTMSEYAVEIERLTVRLENLFFESGSLSTNLFVRLENSLEQADEMDLAALKEINEWWNNLQEDFKRLNQNYQDYLREFYSGQSDRLMKSMEFIIHKDKFISYLKDFIQELQHHSRKISGIIQNRRQMIEGGLLEKVVKSELDIPHAISELHGNREPSIRENVYGKWESLKNWFLDTPEHPCECSKVLVITNDVIRSIILNAALIVQIQNWGISRKEDYRKFLELFMQCEDMEEAHRLSAHVFGVQNIGHFKANTPRDADSVGSSVYEEEPQQYLLKPHVKTYREKKDRKGFADKSFEKLCSRQEYMKKLEQERELVCRFIRDGKLNLAEIHEVIPETARKSFLRWIALANLNSERKGQTEYGQAYRLVRQEGECCLKCEDGELVMPAYVLEFDQSTEGDADGIAAGNVAVI